MNDNPPTGAAVPAELIGRNYLFGLQETFEQVNGVYLDKGTSLLETLAGVTAAQASQQPSPRCATLAGHVFHLVVYLDVIEQFMMGTLTEEVDWEATWRVTTVDEVAWDELQGSVRTAYERLRATIAGFDTWDERQLGGAMGIIAHTAYHLGEIRQMLCHLEQP